MASADRQAQKLPEWTKGVEDSGGKVSSHSQGEAGERPVLRPSPEEEAVGFRAQVMPAMVLWMVPRRAPCPWAHGYVPSVTHCQGLPCTQFALT